MNEKGGGERNGYGNFKVCRMFCEAAVKLSRLAAVSKIFSFFLWSGGLQIVFLKGTTACRLFFFFGGGGFRLKDEKCGLCPHTKTEFSPPPLRIKINFTPYHKQPLQRRAKIEILPLPSQRDPTIAIIFVAVYEKE